MPPLRGASSRPLRRGLAIATAAVIAATAATVTVATPARAATTWPITTAAWASDDGTVMEMTAAGSATQAFAGLAAAHGTSPAVTMLVQGTDNAVYIRGLAVHAANTNTMKYSDDVTGGTLVDSGVAMATGASPAIGAVSDGSAEIAFVGTDNMLRKLNNQVGTVSYPGGGPLAVSPGTNPSVAGNLEARYEIAFHANGGTLCYIDRDNGFHDTGIQMAAGSSPSITSNGGGPTFKIAFAGTDNLLRVYDTGTNAVTPYTLAVEPGTSPSIASAYAAGGNNYKVAFQAKDLHDLWTVTSANISAETHRPMATGTSPSITRATSADLYQVLVNDAGTHTVWALGTEFIDTGLPVGAGTNPSTFSPGNSVGLTPFGPAIDAPKAPFLQAFSDKVIVNWVDLSTAELEFDVQKYDSRGLWTTVNVTPTRNSAGRGNPYAWTDTDQSISGQCYRIVATNGFRFGYSPVSCTVRTPSDIPMTAPGAATQWSGLTSDNGGLGSLANYASLTADHPLYLNRAHRVSGVDLDFQDSPAYWQAQAEGGPQLMKGQAFALYDPTGNGGYLTLGSPVFGINLGFSSTPSYEWYAIGGGHPGDPLGSGGHFALWNSRQRDFLIMPSPCSAGVGVVNLVWYSKSDCATPGPAPDPGVRWYQLYNCASDNQPVSVWIQDLTLNLPFAFKAHLSPTGCGPNPGSVPFNFDPPADNHVYKVVAVDLTRNGCPTDDPTNGFCQALNATFVSNRKFDTINDQSRWQGYLRIDNVNGPTVPATCTPDICGFPPAPQQGGGPSGSSSVALAANANGRMELFGVNPAGVMFHRGQQTAGGSAWGAWVSSATRGWESVGAATNSAGRIELLGVTTSGGVHRRSQTASNAASWFNWTQLTGSMHSVAVATNQNGQLEMFATNTWGQAFYRTQNSPGSAAWGPWQQILLPYAASSVTAATTADHRIELFVLDQAGHVWHSAQPAANDNTWGPFSEFDGPNMVSIAAARNGDGRLELIGLDNSGNAWRRAELTANSDVWDQQWASLPAITSLAYLAVAANPSDGRIQIDAVDQQGQIWQSAQQQANSGSYTSWIQIDGTLRP